MSKNKELHELDIQEIKASDRDTDYWYDKQSEYKKDNKNFDLIVAIVNKGYTDLVMQASRKAGARGGTILTARGTGNSQIGDFYGIAIQPEKEVVFILSQKDKTDPILQSIYDNVGLHTNGQGIAFVIPAGQTVGLTAKEFTHFTTNESDGEN